MMIFFAALIARVASVVDSILTFVQPKRLTFRDRYFLYLQDTLPYDFDETDYPSEADFRREHPVEYELVMNHPYNAAV